MSLSRRLFARAALASGLAPAFPAVAQIAPDAPVSAGQRASTLRELIARYLAWRGGPALEQLQTIHQRYYLQTDTGRTAGQLWFDRDGRLRRETEGSQGREVAVATEAGAWRVGADGKVVDDPGGAERARRLSALEFGDAFRGRAGATVAPAADVELEEHTWSVARISFGDADVYDALVDGALGALGGYLITEGGSKRTVLFGDWRLVDGVRMPFVRLTRAAATAELRLTAVEFNRPIDPSLFARPAG